MSSRSENPQPAAAREDGRKHLTAGCHALGHPHEPNVSEQEIREEMMDKTLADSFPASDPPSSIPDPSADSFTDEDSLAA